MGIKTAGALKALQFVKETTFGTTPSTQLSYGGKLASFDHTNTHEIETVVADGARTTEIVTFGKQSAGFSAELGLYRDSGAYSWTQWLELALGDSGETRGDIDSFSAYVEASPDQHYLFRGSKIDTLTLNATAVGSPLTANLSAVSMQQTMAETKAGVLTNAAATVPALNPVTHSAYPLYVNGSTSITIPAMSYSITITNALTSKEGIVNGMALAAGSAIIPDGALDIRLEYTVVSTSLMWDRLKLAETDGFTIRHSIGGYTLTFEDCWLPGDDFPSRSQSVYDETITIQARDVSWTAA